MMVVRWGITSTCMYMYHLSHTCMIYEHTHTHTYRQEIVLEPGLRCLQNSHISDWRSHIGGLATHHAHHRTTLIGWKWSIAAYIYSQQFECFKIVREIERDDELLLCVLRGHGGGITDGQWWWIDLHIYLHHHLKRERSTCSGVFLVKAWLCGTPFSTCLSHKVSSTSIFRSSYIYTDVMNNM
jgi:hypothetical protein